MAGYMKPQRKDFCVHCGNPFADLESHIARIHTKPQDLPGSQAPIKALEVAHGNTNRAAAYSKIRESKNRAAREFMADLEAGKIRADDLPGSRGKL